MGVFMELKPGQTEWVQHKAHFHKCDVCVNIITYYGDRCDKKHPISCKWCDSGKEDI